MRSLMLCSLSILATLGAVHCGTVSGVESDTSSIEGAAIAVEPIAKLGTGKMGAGDNDINPPDGVIFTKQGNLLLTDALNHRVQVWDFKQKRKLGQFGSPEIFHGEVVDLALSPNGQLIVTDETFHVAYAFEPPTGKELGDLAFTNYKFTGKDLFTDEDLGKVGGVTIDSKGRIYTVDARKNLVSRFAADGTPDPTFLFGEKGSGAFLNHCEGVAIDEKRGNLYVSSEGDSVVQVFDLEDGSYKNQMIGGKSDTLHPGHPTGKRVFQAAVEGLWILDDYLLASDEADGGVGHVEIFDLREETAYNTSADEYAALKKAGKRSGYIGEFGTLCSPDSVAAYTDETGESFVAVADQCNYQVLVYKWSEIVKAGKISRPLD